MGFASRERLLTQRNTILRATRTALWNGGTATSGNPGADLVIVGNPNRWIRLNEAYLILTGFNPAATITITNWATIAGVDTDLTLGGVTWTPLTDPVAYLMWWFWFGSNEVLGTFRFEVFSNQAADDNYLATYEIRYKDW